MGPRLISSPIPYHSNHNHQIIIMGIPMPGKTVFILKWDPLQLPPPPSPPLYILKPDNLSIRLLTTLPNADISMGTNDSPDCHCYLISLKPISVGYHWHQIGGSWYIEVVFRFTKCHYNVNKCYKVDLIQRATHYISKFACLMKTTISVLSCTPYCHHTKNYRITFFMILTCSLWCILIQLIIYIDPKYARMILNWEAILLNKTTGTHFH